MPVPARERGIRRDQAGGGRLPSSSDRTLPTFNCGTTRGSAALLASATWTG
jgi:hypothetical protein